MNQTKGSWDTNLTCLSIHSPQLTPRAYPHVRTGWPVIEMAWEAQEPSREEIPKEVLGFHQDRGHNTEDCFDLKEQRKTLIQWDRLRCFMVSHPQTHPKIDKAPSGNKSPEPKVLRDIKVIAGRSAGGEESNSARKAHLWKVRASQGEVYSTDRPWKFPQVNQWDITFTEVDSYRVQHPHDDALVVTLVIANHQTRRVLIDNEAGPTFCTCLPLSKWELEKISFDRQWKPWWVSLGTSYTPQGWSCSSLWLGSALDK